MAKSPHILSATNGSGFVYNKFEFLIPKAMPITP